MNSPFKRYIVFLFNRVFILYVVFALLVLSGVIQLDKIILHMRNTTLNRRMPSYQYLIRFHEGEMEFEKERFEEQVHYFKKVAQYFPDRGDVYGFLAYSSYYLGKESDALKFSEKAAQLDPGFFWFQYNRGLMHYKKGDDAKAAEILKSVLQFKIEHSLQYMFSSKLYVPFVVYIEGFQSKVVPRFEQGYADACLILTASLLRSKNYQELFQYAGIALSAKLEPQWVYFYFLGVASYESGKFPEAVAFMQKSITLKPDNPKAFEIMGESLKKIGQVKLVEQLLQKASGMEKESASIDRLIEQMRLRLF